MDCPHCGSGLADDAGFCPECGAPSQQSRPSHVPNGVEAEINFLLAQANLSRLRREFEAASAGCVEVLRRHPNNPSAHSLLGDVYRDQGLYAEARGWYQIALQLDPASAADRQKLADVEARLHAAVVEPASGSPLWQRVTHSPRLRLPLGLVLGVAVGCLVLSALVALSVQRDATRATMLDAGVPRMLITPPSRGGEPEQPGRREYPERVVPAAKGPVVHAVAAPPAAPAPPGGAEASRPPQLPPARGLTHAEREQNLLRSLSASAEAEELMVAVDYVTIDPRDDGATLCITARDILASPENRGKVMDKCLRVAELALARDEALTRVTIHCRAPMARPNGVQQEELVFVGDLPTPTLKGAAGRELGFDDALKLFGPSPWWHPRMRPAT